MVVEIKKNKRNSRSGSRICQSSEQFFLVSKPKRSQITIFIILAIIIVVGIIAGFWFFGKQGVQRREKLSPNEFIEKCVKDSVSPSLGMVLDGGGRIDPKLFILYDDEKYNYLCYQQNYYLKCVNHYPMLTRIAELEIRNDSLRRVEECFDDLKRDLEKKGFSVDEGVLDYNVELVPGRILIKVEKELEIVKGDDSQKFDNFDAQLLSPGYELMMVARDIANQEAEYCNFEYNGYMLLYPKYSIKRIDYSDSKIYILKDRRSGIIFKFAIRSCVFPPGI